MADKFVYVITEGVINSNSSLLGIYENLDEALQKIDEYLEIEKIGECHHIYILTRNLGDDLKQWTSEQLKHNGFGTEILYVQIEKICLNEMYY